jgi:glycosyltransferase involved in cell wall biosynthesis
MKQEKIGILHLVDSLASGGAEHVAVILANNLPQDRYRAFLCVSRQPGPLLGKLQPHVIFYDLHRAGRFDLQAVWRLAQFIRRENIRIIHAHTTSLFLGIFTTWLNPQVRLIWHDHFGGQEMQSRPVWLYRPFARQARAVFTVTRQLTDWSVHRLGIPAQRVMYLPNFVQAQAHPVPALNLPGLPGKRLVCVANIRGQKDHLSLVRAMAMAVLSEPAAQLILVGTESDAILAEQAKEEILHLGLQGNVTWLGGRDDVPSILAGCDIGVLASVSEGFPVVLLEYGCAGLAVVATQVGETAEILENGEAGMLVPPANPVELASALVTLLQSSELRQHFGEKLQARVQQTYNKASILQRICHIYEQIL